MTLRECWRDGAYAYLGVSVPGFPNFFMLEAQAHYVVRALRHMRRTRKSYLAVRVRTMTDFIAQIDEWMQGTVWTTRCHNYFRAPNGRVVTQWPRSARVFWRLTRRFRAADYTFKPPRVPTDVTVRAHTVAGG